MRKIAPFLLFSALLFGGAGCNFGGQQLTLQPVTIEYWRTDDAPATLETAFAAYKRLHPNVDIVYRQMQPENYERLLLEALAENRGPDVFSVPNVSLRSWLATTQPLLKETSIPTQTVNDKQQIVTVLQKNPGMSVLQFRNSYVEGVTRELVTPIRGDDGVTEDRILGLPYSADTLGMFFNKDILERASIEKPPATWTDFKDMVQRLTVADSETGVITQSGAALGLAKNVDYATEILTALMMQNGAEMTDESGLATFSKIPPTHRNRSLGPAVEALAFYQNFSVRGTPAYSWNATQPRAFDAFVAGKTAFYFGLPSDIAKIRAAAPRLNLGIAPLPQVNPALPVNVLRYPVEVVSRRTANPDVAWDLVQFVASQQNVGGYLAAAKRPTALRGLIAGQLTDADVGPFAGQVLTAKAWYLGRDYAKVQEAFTFMIETRPTIQRPEYQPIVADGEDLVNQTFNR